ncbi:MAG: fumarate hydratase [Pseudomonadota bacterium]|jgi:fumarate hydratase subunit alpha|nr:fumarate hydratase [Pseudomonadota bacterium]NLX31844.1 fumarate hydratase [Deltaproteobacteria bacterium]HNU84315.1 fumarate hydratase [Syntrophales bacterium]HNZ33750.1 fumarate hydratase [Syntrophales bacterium]HOF73410.1 fumarate hydratase [Syntrophales bacterium]
MREIRTEQIVQAVRDLFIDANCNLGEDVLAAFDRAIETDESPVAREVLRELKENARIARDEQSPLCQDTGLAVLFVEVGQDVHVTGGDLKEALNEGVRRGYGEGYLRKSACHPFTRANTRDNTPAVIHFDIVPGERMRIVAVPKGGGAENMSRVDMLSPSAGLEGIKDFVVKRIEASGSNPCPPTVVGVGIGGTFERSAILAKKALTRRIGQRNADPELAGVEADVLSRINRLGIGPMGYGGNTTSLDVFFEVEPCHIASLPVAVNVQCHAMRHKETIL